MRRVLVAVVVGALSGEAVAVAYPPFGLSPVAWLAFAPIAAWAFRAPTGEALLAAFTAGLVFSVQVWYGLLPSYPSLFAAVLPLFALGYTLPVVLLRWVGIARAMGGVVLGAALFTAAEVLYQDLLRIPLDLGVTQTGAPLVLPLAGVIGSTGISFLLFANAFLVAGVWLRLDLPRARRAVTCIAAGLVLPLAAMAIGSALRTSSAAVECAARARVLQPRIPAVADFTEALDPDLRARVRAGFREAVGRGSASKAQFLFWPEGGGSLLSFRVGRAREELQEWAHTQEQHLFVSTLDHDPEGRTFNSIFSVSPRDGVEKYDKLRPVPVAEGHVTPGSRLGLLSTALGRAGMLICFESVFPSLALELAREGAAFLFVSTSDAPLGVSSLPALHLATSTLRAAETRRALVHASNAGPSAVIDPWGRTQQRSTLLESTELEGCIAPPPGASFYSRAGPWMRRALLVAVALLLAASAMQRRRRVRRGAPVAEDGPGFAALLAGLGLAIALAVLGAGLNLWLVTRGAGLPVRETEIARGFEKWIAPRTSTQGDPPVLQLSLGQHSFRPSAVAFLASFYGLDPMEAPRGDGEDDGLEGAARVARELGFGTERQTASLDALREEGLPVLACFERIGEAVLLSVDANAIEIFAPEMGIFSAPRALFEPLYEGEALRIRPPPLALEN